MISNLILYRIHEFNFDLQAIDQAMAQHAFTPCGATQERSGGWSPARGQEHGAMLESVAGQWMAKYLLETKSVPAKVLARKVDEKAAAIEKQTGRKPGRKELRELKDEAKQELLPMAFAKRSATWVWIDPSAQLLGIATGTQANADAITAALVELLPGASLGLVQTQASASASMAQWLLEQAPPEEFSVDRECELKAADHSGAVVRYAKHPLDIAEVQAHIQGGKVPSRLAMTWESRVSFVLTQDLRLRKIDFLESAFADQVDSEDSFDSDVALATSELSKLISDLIQALGGEHIKDQAAPF